LVEIRKLQPSVGRIALPSKEVEYRPSRVKVVVRRRVDHPPPTPQPTPCVLWQGSVTQQGYGRRKVWRKGERQTVELHRWVMEQVAGRVLRKDEVVMHACDNPLCYRVSHLSIGTLRSNFDDMKEKGRHVKPPVNRFHGEAHPMAKLSAHQVRKIRGYWISGWSIKRIAAEFEVSPTTISRIVNGVRWASGPQVDLLAEARAKLGIESAARPQPSQAQASPVQPSGPVKRVRRIPTAEDLQRRSE
jgi:hypothetical protein